ncbi:MAG: non-ribosomal peptide synthetase, partial [Lysobacter sp.]
MSTLSNVSDASRSAPQLAAVDYDPFAQAALARVVPVTEPQREVWLADKLGSEGSLAYNESVSLRLHGTLDEQALRAAVRELAERHESLRATVSPSGDELCIAEEFVLDTLRSDLSELDPDARDDAMRGRLRAVVEAPFDLERGPLIRVELLALATEEHLLILTAHHIVCDGWSFGVLVRDLAAAYARYVGQPGVDPGPSVSFTEYAWSQAAVSQTAQFQEDERYWLSRFAESIPSLDLPVDRARPRWRTFTAGREDVMLDAELVAGLRKLGARRGASLFASLFTGFTTLMRRLSGQSDVVVGIAAAGQSVGGHDMLVGHCVNILPVRLDVEPGTGFAAVLEATSSNLLDAFEHQQYTFGTLLQKLAIPRDPSRLPLVNVLFNLDQPLNDAVRFPGLEFEFCANARSYENFELFVNTVPVNGGLRLECQYNRDLYDAATIRRWMGALDALLRSAIAEPDRAWDQLDWVSATEFEALRSLQPLPTEYDAGLLVHQRFAGHAIATPDNVAISFGVQEFSYTDLERRSNAIAHALRARNVARGSLVGVCLEREPDLYAAVLGILKSGAAFVPLDPTYPKDRLNFMVQDAGLAAVVSKSALLGTVDYAREQTLALDADFDRQAWDRVEPVAVVDCSATSESPAYVIYTSGSTGKPKGVVVPHRALVNLLCSMQRTPGLSADDRLVAVTTMSFDMSIPELFLPLAVGARVVVASRDDARDGLALRRLLETSGA